MNTYIKGPTTKKSKTLIPIVYPILLITSSSFMLILKVVQRIKTKSIEIEIDRNRMEGLKRGKRAYTGIEPVTSRTLSENHTTRPAGRCLSFQFILHHRHTEPMISKRCYHERTIHSLLYFTCGNTPILCCFSQIVLWSERVWLFVLSVDFGSESTCGIEGNQESVLQGEN